MTIKQGNEIKGGGIYDGKHSSRQCNCTSKKIPLDLVKYVDFMKSV